MRKIKYSEFYGKPVCVLWQDPSADVRWQPSEEAAEHRPGDCISIGWVLTADAGCVVLFSSYNDFGHVASTLSIPIGLVKGVYLLQAGLKSTATDSLLYLTA